LGNVYVDLACGDNAIKAYSDALKLKKDFPDAAIALAASRGVEASRAEASYPRKTLR
jgi:cytochrome c-type biogenesis protein CcmH/NrfG